jgi:hypothetical protein
MKPDYSVKKSIGKGVLFFLQGAAAVLVVTGFAEISIWDLIVQYVKPIVGTLTLGGLIALTTNYVKYNWLG